jgi:hypothetical protein
MYEFLTAACLHIICFYCFLAEGDTIHFMPQKRRRSLHQNDTAFHTHDELEVSLLLGTFAVDVSSILARFAALSLTYVN